MPLLLLLLLVLHCFLCATRAMSFLFCFVLNFFNSLVLFVEQSDIFRQKFESHMEQTRVPLLLLLSAVILSHTATSLTFGVVGDWGMGGYAVGWYAEIRSALQFNEQCAFLKCNFTLSAGDNIYCGNVGECFERSFVQGFKEGNTFFPSIGNHDNVGPQIAYTQVNPRWKFLNRYYHVKLPIDDTGYTVQIFALDTTDGSLGGGGQLAWLETELAKTDARWKVVFGHYPTLGSGRHKRVGTVNRLHDIMHKYNVQAFFCGHDHIVEMNNYGGRVIGISGGMARGGMMWRGLGGATRRFTLTSPGEYNTYSPDWPTHGFMTVDLSPNVMNVNVFEANGGMYYDMSVTWDWMQKRVSSQAAAVQNQWPSPEIVLEAYKEEAKLPLGPGGGVVFRPDGSAAPSSVTPRTAAPGGTLPPETPAPTATPSPVETPVPAATIPVKEPATAQPQEDAKSAVPTFVKYAVSSECVECSNVPTIDVPFTVFVQGMSVSTLCRIFLTSSALGCDVREKPNILSGTTVLTPTSNVVPFTVTGVATTAYVCFSIDKGQTYTRLARADSIFEAPDFVIAPPLGYVPNTTTAAPEPNEQSVAKPGTSAPSSSPSAAGSSQGHSSVTLVLVAMLCIAGGVIGAKYAGSQRNSG